MLLALILWTAARQPVHATTLTVSNSNDGGPGSLRQAIADASSGDTIRFASNLSGETIVLSGGSVTLTKSLTIDGSDLPVAVTLSGNTTNALFTVSAGVAVTLTRLTLVDGKNNFGGAIYNPGTLTLNRVTMHRHAALNGGAIYNVGTLTVLNSTFSGNSAYSGGGIDNFGTLTVTNSTFSANSAINTGGGIFNAGSLYLYNTIIANSSSGKDCLNANEPFFGLYGVIARRRQQPNRRWQLHRRRSAAIQSWTR